MSEVISVTFGRSSDADIRFDDEYMNALHARAWRDEDGRHWIMDLGSTNGTRIVRQGHLLDTGLFGPMEIFPGDVILIGRQRIPWTPK